MKKMLIILSSVVLLFSLLIVPASATEVSEVYEGVIQEHFAYFLDVNPGYYSLNVYTDASRSEMLLNVPSFELYDGTYSLYFDELDSIFTNITLSVNYSENVLQCALSGYSDHTGDPKFDLFGSVRYPNVVAELIPIEVDPPLVPVSVFDVFAGVGSWILTSLGSVSGLFWNATAGQLTILGVLAVAALGVGVVLGLVFIISRFLRFRS